MLRKAWFSVLLCAGVGLALVLAFATSHRQAPAGRAAPATRGAVPHGSICVLDAKGEPVVGAAIAFCPRGRIQNPMRIVNTSESGCAECEVLEEEAPYLVGINIPDSYPELASFERLDGWSGDGVTIRVAPAWNMLVQVVDSKGVPAPGSVVLSRWMGDPSDLVLHPTNEHGQLSMRRLRPEALEVDAMTEEERDAFVSSDVPAESLKFRYRVAWGTEMLTVRMDR